MKKILMAWIATMCVFMCTTLAIGAPQQNELLQSVEQLSSVPINTVFIDARSKQTDQFIPNSIRIDWQDFYNEQTLKSQEDINSLLGSYGITGSEEIIIYDEGAGRGGGSMIFWILDMSGHNRIRILNGGWQAYIQANLPVEKQCTRFKATHFKATSRPQVVMTMKDVLTYYGDYDLKIIDPRSDEEYIGWALNGEKRGGHIRTAINFSPEWGYDIKGQFKDLDAIRKLMLQKGLSGEKSFLIYSNLDTRGTDLYFLLRLLGYDQVAHTAFTYNVWAENSRLPVSAAANFEALVSPQWLDQLIRTGKAPTYDKKKFLVLESSWGTLENAAKDYKIAHIPGAVHFDTDTFENEKHYWDLFEFEELAARFAGTGIDIDTTVIVYSHEPSPIAASIAFWALKYAGVDVRLLNGNFERWKKYGLPMESTLNPLKPVPSFGLSAPGNPQYATSTKQAKKILANPNGRMVSIRSWQEYTGEVSRHAYIKAKGELAGSYWGRAGFGENKSDLSFYTDPDGSYRSYKEVAHMWSDLDIHPNNQVAFYCGTGSRGSTGWFYSYLMGWPDTSVYDSGWYGWSEGKEVSPNPAQRLWDLAE